MTKEKNSVIVNQIIDEMILEIEKLFADRENLLPNMKTIKEITMVLKELEKLYDHNDDQLNYKQRTEFMNKLMEFSQLEVIE